MLRRIVKSHAWSLVPGSKRSGYCKARRSVSWTRSSAASRWPVSDMAKARRCGVADSRPARKPASVSVAEVTSRTDRVGGERVTSDAYGAGGTRKGEEEARCG